MGTFRGVDSRLADIAFALADDIIEELRRQDAKWGTQSHEPAKQWLIIAEEDGETAQAINDHRYGDAITECVQAIACRVRLIAKLAELTETT